MYNFSRNFECRVARRHLKEINWPVGQFRGVKDLHVLVLSQTPNPLIYDPEHQASPSIVYAPNANASLLKLYEQGHLEIIRAELAIQSVMEAMLESDAMYLIDAENEGFEKALYHNRIFRASLEAECEAKKLSLDAKVFCIRTELEKLRDNPLKF